MQQDIQTRPAPVRKMSRLPDILGIAGIILAVIVFVAILISIIGPPKISNSSPQQVTTGKHITKIQTGTGFDQKKAQVQAQTSQFNTSQAVYVVFTVVNQDPKAAVVVKLFVGATLQNTSDTLNPEVGTNIYSDVAITNQSGSYRWEVDYNGAVEASITFNVSG